MSEFQSGSKDIGPILRVTVESVKSQLVNYLDGLHQELVDRVKAQLTPELLAGLIDKEIAEQFPSLVNLAVKRELSGKIWDAMEEDNVKQAVKKAVYLQLP